MHVLLYVLRHLCHVHTLTSSIVATKTYNTDTHEHIKGQDEGTDVVQSLRVYKGNDDMERLNEHAICEY